MGNSKSKKKEKEPDSFFVRARWIEQQKEEQRKKIITHERTRGVLGQPLVTPDVLAVPPGPSPAPTLAQIRSYNDEALARMRWQLLNDSDAFLLNNILLSVQFFENYEREVHQIKNNPISERENLINEAMVRENKHVFFADRLQECVHEHVYYKKSKGQTEPLSAPRLFVIFDNVEASEPGDTSDYSAVLDAPFYKLRIEDSKQPGYVQLKKIEVLESTLHKEIDVVNIQKIESDSVYTESEKESNDSDDPYNASKGEELLEQIKIKLNKPELSPNLDTNQHLPTDVNETTGRRYSGPIKQVSLQVTKNNISNIIRMKNDNVLLLEEDYVQENNIHALSVPDDYAIPPSKSILKSSRRLSGPVINKQLSLDLRKASSESNIGDDTETSGYRSNSSRQTEMSETESDYGYSTIIEAATPKKVELRVKNNNSVTSGVLPDETWTAIEARALNAWSDEEEEINDGASESSLSKNLFERCFYLNSLRFMNNFVNHFIINLGSGLGLNSDQINSALTQGASIYCDSTRGCTKMGIEIIPALVATWPNAANHWIIRERKIIQNPRTNFSYQWPTKYMVNKAIGAGCFLVPVGFRSKRGLNPDQILQWKLIFPGAERYLESCLAHSQIRCYLFTLALHKTFMENETAKIGIDASHIKNHLFWQCEDNYAKWPEDRLGESLRLFLRSFYTHFSQSRMPNYFMENCNEFKSIPKPHLLKIQRQLAHIIETPVMHVLKALGKIKYTKREYYPSFKSQRLYDILTCKNPLRILNPNITPVVSNYQDSSDSDDKDSQINFGDTAKVQDVNYLWAKQRRRQIEARKSLQMQAKRQKSSATQKREINTSIVLPVKMDAARRGLVLEFFIQHFIAMARSSERFEAVRQAIIYLEQAHRLCTLLLEEPGADATGKEYLVVIRDKLNDCQRKLVHQAGFKLPPRRESSFKDRSAQINIRKQRRFQNPVSPDSPVESHGGPSLTFADVHTDNICDNMKFNNGFPGEESKL